MDTIKKNNYVYLNVISCKNQTIVAVCDEEILGKTFKEGKLKLEISNKFYKGSRVKLHEAIEFITNADIANLSGKSIVNSAIKNGLADRHAIIAVSGIPHLQILKLSS